MQERTTHHHYLELANNDTFESTRKPHARYKSWLSAKMWSTPVKQKSPSEAYSYASAEDITAAKDIRRQQEQIFASTGEIDLRPSPLHGFKTKFSSNVCATTRT